MRFRLVVPLLLLAVQTQCQDQSQIRTNPCPNVYGYEWDEDRGWYGVIRIVPPRQFSQLHLVTATSLVFYRRKAGNGSLILDGDKEAVSQKARNGNRQELRFKLFFPPYKDLPRITSIKFNGKEFCPKNYPDTVVTIESKYDIDTGVNGGNDNGNDFKPIGEENTEETSKPVGTRFGDPVRPKPTYQCGKVMENSLPLITHGIHTRRGEWPWQVAINKVANGKKMFICGGSLIGLKAVVTAAHCVTTRTGVPLEPRVLSVYLGKSNLEDKTDVQAGRIDKIIVHPSYNTLSYASDLAVMTLKEDVNYNRFVRPVCLWPTQNTDIRQIVNKVGIVVGWGTNEFNTVGGDLKAASMPVVSQETCIASDRDYFSLYTSDTTFCAGYNNGTSACTGDSGGGFVFEQKQRDNTYVWFLRGLVSTAKRSRSFDTHLPCDIRSYVVFTDLAKYLSFLVPYVSF